MAYIKTVLDDGTVLKVPITDDNMFAMCAGCGTTLPMHVKFLKLVAVDSSITEAFSTSDYVDCSITEMHITHVDVDCSITEIVEINESPFSVIVRSPYHGASIEVTMTNDNVFEYCSHCRKDRSVHIMDEMHKIALKTFCMRRPNVPRLLPVSGRIVHRQH